jgi:glycosyltransferase involved in cell wall biosynthesis
MEATKGKRVVLVHDWLTGMRGGEKCLEVAAQHWPDATLHTLLHQPGSVSEAIERLHIQPSLLNRLPGVQRYYRYLLPLFPAVLSRWHLPACDLVLSFSHCVAKSVRPPANVPHVCYCFTPMRYAWHMRDAYFGQGRVKGLRARAIQQLLAWLRDWDRRTAGHVTHFLAISQTIQQRIAQCYGRESTVLYPPVDTEFYFPLPVPREPYYLIVSAFAPYKRLDLAITACNRLRRTLVIIGQGQDERRLRSLAGPTVHFLGWQPDAVIRAHLQRCQALLFPGEEDFGIVPVEAQACGAPVLVFGKGGATETVIPPGTHREPTGLWFAEQTAESLLEAIRTFEQHPGDFSPLAARGQAVRFNRQRFGDELCRHVGKVLDAPVSLARAA